MLKELYDIEKVSDKLSHSLSRGTLFKEKQVLLPSSIVSRFFEIMGNRPFKAKIQETLSIRWLSNRKIFLLNSTYYGRPGPFTEYELQRTLNTYDG